MKVITVQNPDNALERGLDYLREFGVRQPSRNGAVLVAPGPVTTVYVTPRNRVSMDPLRDANPFFHLAEAMWMLAGRNDVGYVAKFAKNMVNFSDDQETLHGAYGYRWTEHFGYDQLEWIIRDLSADPNSRRAVLSMWDPGYRARTSTFSPFELSKGDLGAAAASGKDVPCNTQAYFRVNPTIGGPVLDMTVTCRSNDIVWGAYGANVVHFSMLQEYMASRLGLDVGVYYQVSNNYHAYVERPDVARLLNRESLKKLATPTTRSVPLEADENFVEEVRRYVALSADPTELKNEFLRTVFHPMMIAHQFHKMKDTRKAIALLKESNIDWHVAGLHWLLRREEANAPTEETR